MVLSLISSTPAFAEASQIIGTINSLVQDINDQIAPAGAGPLNLAIYLPNNSSAINLFSITGGASGSGVTLTVGGDSSETNAGILLSGKGTGDVFLGGSGSSASAILTLDGTASLVNGLTVSGGTSGGGTPSIAATGSDTNIALALASKGTGNITFGASVAAAAATLTLTGVASQANGFTITGATSGAALATIAASGSDTNIDFVVVPKGSGTLRFNTTTSFTANSNVALSLTALGPAALISSTISKWLTVKDSAGGLFYIPCFH